MGQVREFTGLGVEMHGTEYRAFLGILSGLNKSAEHPSKAQVLNQQLWQVS